VINEFGSQSGCNALADEIQRQKLDDGRAFFGQLSLSGAHRNSARMVADRQADLAAIDAVAWALFEELEPVRHARLRVLGWTRAMPALPFITSAAHKEKKAQIYGAILAAALETQHTGVPVDVLPADSEDYGPISKMAARIKGMKLAPGTRSL
jgi:ABC-type phosphate/phosphonate transport system substrate-binding protein